MEEKIDIRRLAMDILLDVEQNKKLLKDALHTTLRRYQYMKKQERAFLTRLCEGTVERQIYLDYVIDKFSKTRVEKCKPVIRVLLRMTVYQICFMDSVPPEAAVNEAVKLARKKGFHQLAGFVNGVLRSIVRGREHVKLPDREQDGVSYLSVRYSMPLWLVEYLLAYYGFDTVEGMLQAFLEENGTCIRINRSKCDLSQVVEALKAKDIQVETLPYLKYGLRISGYNYMLRVPGFQEGYFTVQDVSSMLVGEALAPKAGSLILDLCAAPGGKALDAADRLLAAEGENAMRPDTGEGAVQDEKQVVQHSSGCVIARDVSRERLLLVEENLKRAGFHNVTLSVGDATVLDETMLGKADYVICDVPCSGIGVIGRKQEIKYRLTRQQLSELAALQRKILENAWRYLKVGGSMIFSTCTINPEENEENFRWLLKSFPLEAESLDSYLPETLLNGDTRKGYLTLIPGTYKGDGFFISRLRRVR